MQSIVPASLRAAVESRFSAAGPRPWPPPRSGSQESAPEQYSRCPDPGKDVVTQQRLIAWACALADAGVATVAPMGVQEGTPWGVVQSISISAMRPGTQPVFLGLTSDRLPGVIIAYGDPGVVLTAEPACGCDACDDGSDLLVEAIDDAFESVVLGEVLIEHGGHSARVVTRTGQSTSASVSPDPFWVTGGWHGSSWLD